MLSLVGIECHMSTVIRNKLFYNTIFELSRRFAIGSDQTEAQKIAMNLHFSAILGDEIPAKFRFEAHDLITKLL